ncbi:hypothetical protein AMTR_s00006p00178670 [Amborella trichopoda]|uniref:Uncharacterized protein n=1 Tax=Amborella trichopoda TaxID=13333 RepID=W1PDJ2_AMBTC|nr:hypothetical protein AMTR_s00006p00178670 [Amborella trichopoda]
MEINQQALILFDPDNEKALLMVDNPSEDIFLHLENGFAQHHGPQCEDAMGCVYNENGLVFDDGKVNELAIAEPEIVPTLDVILVDAQPPLLLAIEEKEEQVYSDMLDDMGLSFNVPIANVF